MKRIILDVSDEAIFEMMKAIAKTVDEFSEASDAIRSEETVKELDKVWSQLDEAYGCSSS